MLFERVRPSRDRDPVRGDKMRSCEYLSTVSEFVLQFLNISCYVPMNGVEPSSEGYESSALPLSYTGIFSYIAILWDSNPHVWLCQCSSH